jgi:DNA-binding NarL/FixJ family response regulator
VSDEKTVKRQSILIIEPDAQFREELYNFLLSDGYEMTEKTESLSAAFEKIRQSAYDVIVADAGAPSVAGLQFATYLAQLSPGAMIILMIEADERQLWDQIATQSREVRFLIKTDFARNLLYLLEENTQP